MDFFLQGWFGASPASAAYLMGVLAAAAVFSGLSGFGMSALGSLSLLVLPPTTGVPLLMALSLVIQLLSLRSLWPALRPTVQGHAFRRELAVLVAGGLLGMPVGLLMLQRSHTQALLLAFGCLLSVYAFACLVGVRPPRSVRPTPPLGQTVLVGLAGGVIGGFTAFPSCLLVVRNARLGLPKVYSRALTQLFIVLMQTLGLGLLLWQRPDAFGPGFWRPFWLVLPGVLAGNALGLALFKKTGDIGYRQITLGALGVVGAALIWRGV